MDETEKNKNKRLGTIIISIIVFIVVLGVVIGLTTPSSSTKNVYIGEEVTNNDNVVYKVTNVKNTKHLGSEFLGEDTEYNFIVITIKVQNKSNKNITVSGSCADLYSSSGVKYEYKSTIYTDFIISEDIGSGLSKTFQIAFETPKTTKEETYTLKIGYSSFTPSSNRVAIILKNN